jgi:hypothetical protein
MFLVEYQGQSYLFDSPFDETADEYADHYDVFRMPEPTPKALGQSWSGLRHSASEELGRVPVVAVQFDETRRNSIDTEVLERLIGSSNG